jgi:XTP/dITP diphosphohydrolase
VQLLLATTNEGKIVEIREALAGLPLTILTPRTLAIVEQPGEMGSTFEENAITKARFYVERTSLPTLADDSGIIVEALKEELGIHTRRWGAGPTASDEEWIAHFLERMQHEGNRRACFVCSLAYIDPGGELRTFEGRCAGVITDSLEAPYLPGLPISACFRPEGCSCVFSALPVEQKNYTSHRGRALQKFRTFLEEELRRERM